MNSPRFPIQRAIAIAEGVMQHVRGKHGSLFDVPCVQGLRSLLETVAELGIYVRRGESLPSGVNGMTLRVAKTPFVVLSSRLEETGMLVPVLAHELAHNLLGHAEGPSPRVLGNTGTMVEEDHLTQLLYKADVEAEAELLALQIVIPDRFIQAILEEHIWFPSRRIAGENGIAADWVAARVDLYRRQFGYDQSFDLAKRLRDPFSRMDLSRWVELERPDGHGLPDILPPVSQDVLSMWASSPVRR